MKPGRVATLPRLSFALLVAFGAVASLFAACSSSSTTGDPSGSSPCRRFCETLRDGQSCGELDVGRCKDECKDLSATCDELADDLLDCLERLSYECLAEGLAAGYGDEDPGVVTNLYTPSSTLEIHDVECGELAIAFETCTPPSTSATTSVATSGVGGGSAASSATTATGAGGGGNDCPPDHPIDCGGSCWSEGVDCSSVVDCDGDLVACSLAQSAEGRVVDCEYHACVATPASCAGDAEYPQFCPARHGVFPSCWAQDIECATIVRCADGQNLGCYDPGTAVDCAAIACLAPVTGEASDAECSNGIDDDGNGYKDCGDYRCLGNPTITVCAGETDEGACTDGIDNDGNGYADCADYACQISPSVTACSNEHTEDTCHDNVDNDADGKTDCADLRCSASAFVACP
jgi:hypothetical protein